MLILHNADALYYLAFAHSCPKDPFCLHSQSIQSISAATHCIQPLHTRTQDSVPQRGRQADLSSSELDAWFLAGSLPDQLDAMDPEAEKVFVERDMLQAEVQLLKGAAPASACAAKLIEYMTAKPEPMTSPENEWATAAAAGDGCCSIM